MPKYRKKPVVIEAVKYNPEYPASHSSMMLAMIKVTDTLGIKREDNFEDNTLIYVWSETFKHYVLHIKTLEGTMNAMPGDWIIKGVEGEIYPCKPDIFEKTYEEITDAQI